MQNATVYINLLHLRVIERPRLLVLSGGIDFQRSERMIACLDTLVEAEQTYIEVQLVVLCRATKPCLSLRPVCT